MAVGTAYGSRQPVFEKRVVSDIDAISGPQQYVIHQTLAPVAQLEVNPVTVRMRPGDGASRGDTQSLHSR